VFNSYLDHIFAFDYGFVPLADCGERTQGVSIRFRNGMKFVFLSKGIPEPTLHEIAAISRLGFIRCFARPTE
jgi:hypothetical protein